MTAPKKLAKISCERCRRMPMSPPLHPRAGMSDHLVSTEPLRRRPQPSGRIHPLVQTDRGPPKTFYRLHKVCIACFFFLHSCLNYRNLHKEM